MGNLWLRIRIWTKISLFALLAIYVLFFVYNNSSKPVTPWFWFGRASETSVLVVVLSAFLTGVVVTILVSTTFKTLQQVRDLRRRNRTERLESEMAEMRSKAGMLRSKAGTADEASTPEA